MFFNGSIFWFLMGMLSVLVALAFRAFAQGRGWHLTWSKGLLAGLWYALVLLTLYAAATLKGEHESTAGLRLAATGLFLCLILGVGLWRLLSDNG